MNQFELGVQTNQYKIAALEDQDNVESVNNLDKAGVLRSKSDISQELLERNSIGYVFQGFKWKSLTVAFCLIFVLIYVDLQFYQITCQYLAFRDNQKKLNIQQFDCTLYEFGGRSIQAFVSVSAYGRLFSSIWFHRDFIQIIMNIFCLLSYGFVVENHYGKVKYLIVFFGSAFLGCLQLKKNIQKGNLTSIYIYQDQLMSGAASGLYGIFGMNLLLIKEGNDQFVRPKPQTSTNHYQIIGTLLLLYYLDDLVDGKAMPVAFLAGYIISFIICNDAKSKYQLFLKALFTLLLFTYTVYSVYLIESVTVRGDKTVTKCPGYVEK